MIYDFCYVKNLGSNFIMEVRQYFIQRWEPRRENAEMQQSKNRFFCCWNIYIKYSLKQNLRIIYIKNNILFSKGYMQVIFVILYNRLLIIMNLPLLKNILNISWKFASLHSKKKYIYKCIYLNSNVPISILAFNIVKSICWIIML